MPYLNLDLDYFSHPKTNRLIGLLGRGSEAFPLRLWCYCGKYHPGDGRLSDYSVQEIESVLGWCGESGKLVQALLKVGFLHKDTKGYYVHDWLEHEGHLEALKERAKTAAKARWNKYRQVNNSQQVIDVDKENTYATSNAQASPKHCLTNAPYHTKPNLTKPKEKEHSPPSLYNPRQGQQNRGRESDSSLKEKSEKSHKSDPLSIQLTTQGDDAKKRKILLERFLNFWKTYPRRVKMALCEQIWFETFFPLSEQKAEDLYSAMITAIERQKATWDDPKYIPAPDNWLKDQRWLDEITQPKTHEDEVKETAARLRKELKIEH